MALLEATMVISEDEWCYGLREDVLRPAGLDGPHRYQRIKVVRHDRLVEWRDDMGPADAYKATPNGGRQFFIPSGQTLPDGKIEMWHRVWELREMADRLRNAREDRWPDIVTTDWEQAFHDEADRRRREATKVSIFGPLFAKMRY